MYLNWNSSAATSGNRETLKTLIDRAYLICSSPELWKQDIQHLKQVYHEKNDYPKCVTSQVVEQAESKHQTVTHANNLPVDDFKQTSATNKEKSYLILLQYLGQTNDFALKPMRKKLKTLLLNNFNMKITFKDKKLNSCLKFKDTLILNINTILLIMESVLCLIL